MKVNNKYVKNLNNKYNNMLLYKKKKIKKK